MITDEEPLWGLLVYEDLGFSHTLHDLTEGDGLFLAAGKRSNFGSRLTGFGTGGSIFEVQGFRFDLEGLADAVPEAHFYLT